MGDPTILEPPAEGAQTVEPEVDEQEEDAEKIPSVFSVTTRYLVGAADVSSPAEDGSHVVRLFSGDASAVIEANLSPVLSAFISAKLAEVEIIEEAEVVEEDAKPTPE